MTIEIFSWCILHIIILSDSSSGQLCIDTETGDDTPPLALFIHTAPASQYGVSCHPLTGWRLLDVCWPCVLIWWYDGVLMKQSRWSLYFYVVASILSRTQRTIYCHQHNTFFWEPQEIEFEIFMLVLNFNESSSAVPKSTQEILMSIAQWADPYIPSVGSLFSLKKNWVWVPKIFRGFRRNSFQLDCYLLALLSTIATKIEGFVGKFIKSGEFYKSSSSMVVHQIIKSKSWRFYM